MATKRIVVIGASAGGIEALRTLVSTLPADFPAPICVVLHTSPQSPGVLDSILARAGSLEATNAVDRERLNPAHIYVAPPDFHLVIEPGKLRVVKGPRENRFRPAIDPLFRSAAQVYGPGTIGVILTGSLDDGTAGLWAIRHLGGTAIVQDPDDALYPAMPQSAISHVGADHVLPITAIGPMLVALLSAPIEVAGAHDAPDALPVEVKIAMEQNPIAAGLERVGEPSAFSCPECHGVLLQLKEGGRIRFRCHTGHAYSVATLLASINEGIEDALWIAIRALEEEQLLLSALADHFMMAHSEQDPAMLKERADEARRHSDVLRTLVTQRDPVPTTK